MIDKKNVIVVIPARLGGYRFPDKPLRISSSVSNFSVSNNSLTVISKPGVQKPHWRA